MWYALAQCEKIPCLEVLHLKRLNDAVDRFARSHPRFGIPNLMKVLVIGNIIVYFLARFSSVFILVSLCMILLRVRL